LDVLINNVGALFGLRHETVDGIEATLAVNHLCPYLLTRLLLPALAARARARIVNVNSEGHRRAPGIAFDDLQTRRWRRGFPVYSQAKLANLLFTYALARRLEGSGVTVNAVHPGIVDTELVQHFLREQFFAHRRVLNRASTAVARWLAPIFIDFDDVEAAARPVIRLASAPEFEGVSGQYFNKNVGPCTSSAASYDQAVGERLWRVSAELTHLGEDVAADLAASVSRDSGDDRRTHTDSIAEGA
jgi:NAD(P)-dependent dehydrogenase (short-subunit alcohol dehydrogenase family)